MFKEALNNLPVLPEIGVIDTHSALQSRREADFVGLWSSEKPVFGFLVDFQTHDTCDVRNKCLLESTRLIKAQFTNRKCAFFSNPR